MRIVVDGHMQTKWRCFCSLGSLSERFPCEDYGVTPGGEVPAFQSKKVRHIDRERGGR